MTGFLGPQLKSAHTLNAGVWVHPRTVAQWNIPKEVRQATSGCRDLHLWLGVWPWGLPTCCPHAAEDFLALDCS